MKKLINSFSSSKPIIPVFHYSNTPDETLHHSTSPANYAQQQRFSPETQETGLSKVI